MRKALTAACACLALAACSVGPKYKRPSAPVPPAYKEPPPGNDQWKTANPSDGALRADWWKLFNDPRLDELEAKVTVSNQNVKQAEAAFRQARYLVAYNHAGYFPIITAQPGMQASAASVNLGSGIVSGSTAATGGAKGVATIYSLPFGVSWEPNFWGRISLAVQSAVAQAQASAAQLGGMKLSMQADLASNYFAMEAVDMEEHLLQTTIEGYQRALQLTILRQEHGVASRADVVAAQAQLATARAALTDLGIARAQYEHAIAVLTGQPPAGLSLAPGKMRGTPPPIPAGLPSQLLERRPDIAASERLVMAANAQIGLARAAYFPAVALSAAAGLESSSILNWLSWPSRFWSAGPTIAQSVFDFGRRHAQSAEAGAAYDNTVAAYRQTVLTAFQEVEDNLAALRQLEIEAAQQDSAVRAAQESLRLEMDQYRSGTVSYLDVITAQTIALSDQRAAVQTLGRRFTSAVQLILALGGGWNSSSLPAPSDMYSTRGPRTK